MNHFSFNHSIKCPRIAYTAALTGDVRLSSAAGASTIAMYLEKDFSNSIVNNSIVNNGIFNNESGTNRLTT